MNHFYSYIQCIRDFIISPVVHSNSEYFGFTQLSTKLEFHLVANENKQAFHSSSCIAVQSIIRKSYENFHVRQ